MDLILLILAVILIIVSAIVEFEENKKSNKAKKQSNKRNIIYLVLALVGGVVAFFSGYMTYRDKIASDKMIQQKQAKLDSINTYIIESHKFLMKSQQRQFDTTQLLLRLTKQLTIDRADVINKYYTTAINDGKRSMNIPTSKGENTILTSSTLMHDEIDTEYAATQKKLNDLLPSEYQQKSTVNANKPLIYFRIKDNDILVGLKNDKLSNIDGVKVSYSVSNLKKPPSANINIGTIKSGEWVEILNLDQKNILISTEFKILIEWNSGSYERDLKVFRTSSNGEIIFDLIGETERLLL